MIIKHYFWHGKFRSLQYSKIVYNWMTNELKLISRKNDKQAFFWIFILLINKIKNQQQYLHEETTHLELEIRWKIPIKMKSWKSFYVKFLIHLMGYSFNCAQFPGTSRQEEVNNLLWKVLIPFYIVCTIRWWHRFGYSFILIWLHWKV